MGEAKSAMEAARMKGFIEGARLALMLVKTSLDGNEKVRGKLMTKEVGKRNAGKTISTGLPPEVNKLLLRVRAKIKQKCK
jgi:hypothetical protein